MTARAGLRAALRRVGAHWLISGLLVVGAGMRVLTMIAYRPSLFFADSWGYLSAAFAQHLLSFAYLHPVGYPILIRLLLLPGRSMTRLVVLQHLSGLLVGGLVYATLVRAGVRRAWAAAAAALVLLDGYAITLEQYVMADTFFTLTLVISALILTWGRLGRRPGPIRPASTWRAAVAGLVFAAAALQREVGVFVVPVAGLYLVWIGCGVRQLTTFVVTVAVVLGGYAGVMEAKTGVFGLTATSGWNLYSRVAGFADCRGAHIASDAAGLCQTAAQRDSHPTVPDWYRWDAASPAMRLFHRRDETRAEQVRANAILGAFARRIITHQPVAFVEAVGADFLRYFTPGATPYADAVSATSLPVTARRETVIESVRRQVLSSVHPRVVAPAALVRRYRSAIHVPRPVLALLALAALLGMAVRVRSRHEVFLFGGVALMLLLATSATAGFGLRYLLPAVPLLALGGGLALRDLAPTVIAAPPAAPRDHKREPLQSSCEQTHRMRLRLLDRLHQAVIQAPENQLR